MDRRRAGSVWGFVALVALLAGAVQWFGVLPLPGTAALSVGIPVWVWVVVLLPAFLVGDRFCVKLRPSQQSIEFSMMQIPMVIGLFFLPAALLVPVRLAGCLVNQVLERRPAQRTSFNMAMYALETGLAVVVWHLVLDGADPLGPRGWAAVIVSTLVTSALSSLLVTIVVSIHAGSRVGRIRELVGLGEVGAVVNACFALIAVYVLAVDWRASWLFLVLAGTVWFAFSSFDSARKRTESLEQVNRFTELVGREVELDAVVGTVLAEVRDAFRSASAHLRLAEVADDWCLVGDRLSRGRSGLLDALAGRAGGEPVLVPRRVRLASLAGLVAREGVADCLMVPLRSEGKSVGSLVVADTVDETDTYRADDLRHLRALANHAAVAIDNAVRADQLIRAAEERERRASYDELTGLANRQLLVARTGEALAAGSAAVLMLDIDRFKQVNDTLGHDVADQLLCRVARCLERAVDGAALVAHPGGDEFAVLLPGADADSAARCGVTVQEVLTVPFGLHGVQVAVTASLGVAVGARGADAVTVLRRAGLAMYAAKDSRTGLETYRPELERHDSSRLGLLADLRSAVAAGEISVSYQVKVDVRTGRVEGVEALARWQHPEHGAVGPDEFIPLAEHSSLITPLTMLVLRRALADLDDFQRGTSDPLSVAVNISPRSLLDHGFVDCVAELVAGSGLAPAALVLEITETSLMTDPDRAVTALHRLRGLGVRLSVDDLGTGYSSLAYLQRLPVDEIKIDRSFLRSFPDASAQAVVGAIVDLGHRLGHRVVAEGVEDEAAYLLLGRLGVDAAQGYWLARPEPADVVGPVIGSWAPRTIGRLRQVR